MNAPSETLQRPLALLASLPAGDAAALLERLPTSSIQRLIETLPHVPHVACQMPDAVAQALAEEWGDSPGRQGGSGAPPSRSTPPERGTAAGLG